MTDRFVSSWSKSRRGGSIPHSIRDVVVLSYSKYCYYVTLVKMPRLSVQLSNQTEQCCGEESGTALYAIAPPIHCIIGQNQIASG